MRYTIAATILAAAMGLAPAAQADRLLYRVAPTNQGQNQTGQILGGLAALGALGLVIREMNDDDDDKRRVHDRHDRRGWDDHHDRRGWDDRHDRRGWDDRHDRRGWDDHRDRRGWDDRGRHLRRADVLPGDCLRRVDNRRGPDRIFGARCLARSGVELRRLPGSCRTDVYAGGRYHAAYAARCLQHQGWRVARHR